VEPLDRRELLGPRRNAILSLAEVEGYGRDSFGDPGYVSLYGLEPAAAHARGVRLLGRTAVECTRDRLAELIARDVAAVAAAAGAARIVVLDPFAGSCNTLVWLARCLPAARAVGFELDDGVHAATRRNLAAVGLDATVELRHEPFETGLATVDVPTDALLAAFVAPPWGDALDQAAGLDLGATSPPVATVVDRLVEAFGGRRLLLAVQLFERVTADSLAAVAARFAWSRRTTYDIDPPGRNHGLLVGTVGWTPESL
jgi:hypothetical protein